MPKKFHNETINVERSGQTIFKIPEKFKGIPKKEIQFTVRGMPVSQNEFKIKAGYIHWDNPLGADLTTFVEIGAKIDEQPPVEKPKRKSRK